MGCDVYVGGGDTAATKSIERLFAERDRMFSRFRPESELNRVNAQAGRPVGISPAFASMVELALEAARDTHGLVDPTLGAALEAAGYDADFASLRDHDGTPAAGARGCWAGVRVAGRLILFPAHARLDLNGVVKSKTVDDALTLLPGDGFVSAGGDLAARGGAAVALPEGSTVRLLRGALATSGTDRRRWLRGGAWQHHLIDPRTGGPVRSRWQQVTACGATCVSADVAAKAAFLLSGEGPAWLDRHRVPGRFVDLDGTVYENDAWCRSLSREIACT
jgi:thiamine biosynthesis lipoprotein